MAQPDSDAVHIEQHSAVPRHDASEIHITDAMSSTEFSKSSYIVYLISSPGHEAKRRYSEFEALRDALVQLHPTLIIPPIPSKHSILDYATKQGRAKNDPAMIARRKRMLERFLQRLDMHPVLRMDVVFRRFLDPRYTWHEIAHTPPITTLPRHNLNAPPQNPADPDAPSCYSFLPTPSAPLKLHAPDAHFQEADAFTHRFGHAMASTLEPANRRLVHRWGDIATDLADLGALLNAQSLAEQSQLASAMERTGQAVDTMQVALSGMLHAWEAQVTEPIAEYTQYASILSKVLQWRHLKHQQLEVACDLIESKHQRLAELEKEEAHAARLNRALETGGSSLVSRRNTHAQRSVYSRAAESEPEEAEEETPEVDTSADDLTSMWARKAAPAPQPPRQRSLLDTFTNRFASVMDLDSDKSRHSSISRLREEVVHLQEAIEYTEKDLAYANKTIQASLDRFQRLKVQDTRQLMLDLARMHREFCAQSLEAWRQAREEVEAVDEATWEHMPSASFSTNNDEHRAPHISAT